MSRSSPLGAFCGGLAAGLAGALAQSLFFAATRKLAPEPSAAAFEPAEPEQAFEMPTQTIARRVQEQLVRRGPLEHKAAAGQIVHFAFGSAWGGAYGLVAGTLPGAGTLKGGLCFGLIVWLVSDDILLPAFRLSAWPQHYPVKNHVYAVAAHAVYGAALAGAFALARSASTPMLAALGARYHARRVPRLLRPLARRVLDRGIRIALPVHEAALALR